MPHEVKVHYNLATGGYSVHEHGRGTTERAAPAVLLIGAYGHVMPAGHQQLRGSIEAQERGQAPLVLVTKKWRRVRSGATFVCQPDGDLDPPQERVMGERNLFAWSVGTRGSERELEAALADAEAGRGSWAPAGFDVKKGCFAHMVGGRFQECLPNDRSIDVILMGRPNVMRLPGLDGEFCRPLYRPSRGAWKKPPAFAPAMFWRPTVRANPFALAAGGRPALGGVVFPTRREAQEAAQYLSEAEGGRYRVVNLAKRRKAR